MSGEALVEMRREASTRSGGAPTWSAGEPVTVLSHPAICERRQVPQWPQCERASDERPRGSALTKSPQNSRVPAMGDDPRLDPPRGGSGVLPADTEGTQIVDLLKRLDLSAGIGAKVGPNPRRCPCADPTVPVEDQRRRHCPTVRFSRPRARPAAARAKRSG